MAIWSGLPTLRSATAKALPKCISINLLICAVWSDMDNSSPDSFSHSAIVSANWEASLPMIIVPSPSLWLAPIKLEFRAWNNIVLLWTRKRYFDCVTNFKVFSRSNSAGNTLSILSSVNRRTKVSDDRMARETMCCSSSELSVPVDLVRYMSVWLVTNTYTMRPPTEALSKELGWVRIWFPQAVLA